MRNILNVFLLFLVSFFSKGATKKANVIVILSDDQGYGDFSCHGNPILRTPNLDKMHDEGVRFSNFHVSPLSTPTRGQLLTGLDAMHNKASTVLNGSCMMRRDIITMPEVFKENGYQTGIFGKWHLGDNYPDRPMDRGFIKSQWIKGWGLLSEMEFDNDYYRTRYMDSLTVVQSELYCTDLWFKNSMEWMEEKQDNDEPFFTYIALNAPHGPVYAPKEDYLSYCKTLDEKTAQFLGMVQNIDKNVGKLMQWLDARGLKDNTLVVFMNDNGGTGGVDVFNAYMRGQKGDIYDGGHRAACFIQYPEGGFGLPRTIEAQAEIQDLLPTFIDLFGLELDSQHQFDGVSLKPVLKGQALADRKFVVQIGNHVNPAKYNSAVVWNNWRLVKQDELYDLTNDPGQQTNVASQHPDIVNEMKNYYEGWWTTVNDPNETFIPLVVGNPISNPVILASSDWIGTGPNTQWNVALAKDDPNGYWIIDVATAGTYRLELSRWPFHLNRPLSEVGPSVAVGGTSIRPGNSLAIKAGAVSLNNQAAVSANAAANATKITIEIDMPQGINTLKAFFKDKSGAYLTGAYYVRVEKI